MKENINFIFNFEKENINLWVFILFFFLCKDSVYGSWIDWEREWEEFVKKNIENFYVMLWGFKIGNVKYVLIISNMWVR